MRYVLPVCLAFLSALGATSSSAAPYEGHFDRTLPVTGTVDLDAATSSGGIVITRGASGTVRIHATLRSNNYPFGLHDAESAIREIERNPPVEQNGNTLRVGYLGDSHLLEGVSIHLDIEVPADTRVNAQASSGGIRVTGVHGLVDVRTHSGGITLSNIDGDVTASANSGGIEANIIAGAINVRTSSGGIHVSQTKAAPVNAQASSGGVAVTLASGAGYNLNADTGSGRITTPEMTVHGSFSRHHIEGKIRGGGPEVTVQASSGSVHVD